MSPVKTIRNAIMRIRNDYSLKEHRQSVQRIIMSANLNCKKINESTNSISVSAAQCFESSYLPEIAETNFDIA